MKKPSRVDRASPPGKLWAGVTRRRLLQGAAVSLLLGSAATRAAGAAAQGVKKKGLSFAAVVRRRAMVRAYKNDPVPEEKIQRLLAYAVRAPSAGNLQPWEFIVVKDLETRAKLAKAAFDQTSVASAPLIIATCADVQRAGSKYGARGSFYSLVDTAFASLLILLGAVEQGLGACFVGSYNPDEVAKLFALPDHVRPVGLITIGYPAESPRKPGTPKLPLSKLVHAEKW
ncbi:MAG TPA: nitroreductase family protein [Candidatus Binatia bacterium]|nr:nitroreductase family protein [Candidatus Binatia bacterium]